MQPSSAYSPGLPLLVAGVYALSGGTHLTLALILLALIAAGAIPMAYLLGRRFGGPLAGLLGAGALAFYPALLEFQGLLLTEPLAAFLLSAGLVAYLHAASPPLPGRAKESDMDGLPSRVRGCLGHGVGPGFSSACSRWSGPSTCCWRSDCRWSGRSGRRCEGGFAERPSVVLSLLATCLVLAPWAVRNEVVLRRFVPISTGGGKALFIGTYLEADGDAVKLRELLLAERPALRARFARGGPIDDPDRMVLERVLGRVAAESYPGLETDAALGRLGRQNLEDDISRQPLRFAGMLISKSYETWTDAARGVMLDEPWRALQLAIVLLSLAGLAILAWRRRFEALVAGLVLLYMTAIAALLIASPRRELVVLPLLTALAGAAVAAGRDSLARRWAG